MEIKDFYLNCAIAAMQGLQESNSKKKEADKFKSPLQLYGFDLV